MNWRSLRRVLSTLIVAFVQLPVMACAASEGAPFQELIRESFEKGANGPGFFMKSQDGNFVEVCGDICAYFEWHGDANNENVWRFIVLYELNDGPGTDVPAFRDSVKAIEIDKLVERKYCSMKGKDIATIDCDWKSYSHELGISVGHTRYDEGNRCFAKGLDRDWDKLKLLKWTCSPMNPEESPYQMKKKP